jgi:cytidylate kinase
MQNKMRIAINGLAASGKSTIAKAFARTYGIKYIDTGIISRFAAYCLTREIVDSLSGIIPLFQSDYCRYLWDGERARIYFGSKFFDRELEDPQLEEEYLRLAAEPDYFAEFKDISETIMAGVKQFIADGRNVGTTILPNADVKFYIDADVNVRAKRWSEEQKKSFILLNYPQACREIIERDKCDRTREIDPLRIPENAIVIDNSKMSVEDAVAEMHNALERKGISLIKQPSFSG